LLTVFALRLGMLPFEYCHAALETASMGLKKKRKKPSLLMIGKAFKNQKFKKAVRMAFFTA
jgi:hypothetical protein